MAEQITIAIDAMGGDNAPASMVEGAAIARAKCPHLHFHFFGPEETLSALLKAQPNLKDHYTITHTDDVVADDVKPSVALRQGKKSSLQLAILAVKNGDAQAVVSGGNTGAFMAMAKLSLRMLKGIKRPAAASLFPTETGQVVMLDLGANLDCSAEELFQFSIMGDAYARTVLGIKNPTIGLLNVGEESHKGHPELQEAATMLRNVEMPLNFIGFVEGNDIPMGKVDVVVTDGFSGNIMLKTAEGTAKLIRKHIKEAFQQNWATKLSYLLASKTMGRLRKRLDPRRYNGAMFLGLNGVAVKSHGGSDAYAVSHAIRTASSLLEHKANQHISREIAAGNLSSPSEPTEAASA